MNTTLDTALTIGGFAMTAAVVIFLVPWGMYGSLTAMGAEPPDQPARGRFNTAVGVGSLIIPPVLLIAANATALLLALTATGLTFYYPLIGLSGGIAAWYGAILGLSTWYKSLRRARLAGHRKEYASPPTADQAISAVRDHLAKSQIDYPTTELVADRFSLGWSVYAPGRFSSGDPEAFQEDPRQAVFLVGDSGRIQQIPSPTLLQIAQKRFTAEESLMRPFRGRWVRRRR